MKTIQVTISLDEQNLKVSVSCERRGSPSALELAFMHKAFTQISVDDLYREGVSSRIIDIDAAFSMRPEKPQKYDSLTMAILKVLEQNSKRMSFEEIAELLPDHKITAYLVGRRLARPLSDGIVNRTKIGQKLYYDLA